jgi:hypothetical protein
MGQCASLQHKPKRKRHKNKPAHKERSVNPSPTPAESFERMDRFYFGSPMRIIAPVQVLDPVTEKKISPTPTPPKSPKERPREPF